MAARGRPRKTLRADFLEDPPVPEDVTDAEVKVQILTRKLKAHVRELRAADEQLRLADREVKDLKERLRRVKGAH